MSNRHSFGGRGGGNAGLGSGSVGRGGGVSGTGCRSTVSLENKSITNLNKLNSQPSTSFSSNKNENSLQKVQSNAGLKNQGSFDLLSDNVSSKTPIKRKKKNTDSSTLAKLHKKSNSPHNNLDFTVSSDSNMETSDSEDDLSVSSCDKSNNGTTSNNNKLDAIKIKIRNNAVEIYKNYVILANEISRCKADLNSQLKIKFAYLNSQNSMVVIATDDPESHSHLSSEWPSDAFGGGAVLLNKKSNSESKKDEMRQIVLKSIHTGLDLNEPSIRNQLASQGILEPNRKFTRDNKPTTIVTAKVKDKEHLDYIINNGFYLGFTKLKTAEPFLKLNQCYNCQKFGHTKNNCDSHEVCAKCGRNHNYKICKSETAICSNCGGAHWSFSRICQHVIDASKTQQVKFYRKTNSFIKVNSAFEGNTYAGKLRYNQVDNIDYYVKSIVEKVVKEKLESIVNRVMDVFTNAIANVLESLNVDNNPILNNFNAALRENLLNKSNKEILKLSEDYLNYPYKSVYPPNNNVSKKSNNKS